MNVCWASSLGNCKGKLTKEHIVSDGLLDNKTLVQGFAWCEDKQKEIYKSLTNHILCEKHNKGLENFDAESKNFKSIVSQCNNQVEIFSTPGFEYRNKILPITYYVNGFYLERWFCKTLIDIVLTRGDDCNINYKKILPYIFGDKKFEKPYGLYTDCTVGLTIGKEFLQVIPVFKKSKELSGAVFVFQGFHFRLQLPNNEPTECLDESRFINDFDEDGNIRKKQYNWHNEYYNMEFNNNIVLTTIFRWN